jgi:glycosyltransferase involved in cell wall biosynthesis
MISFSVVVPAHNAEKTIRKCLLSVFSQKLMPKDLIIVNDNSTDSTEEIIVEVIGKNIAPINCVLINNNENLGPGESRNIALNNATGDYVCFLDADDYFYNNKLFVLAAKIELLNSNVELLAHPMNKIMDKDFTPITIFSSVLYNSIETTSAVCMKNKSDYRFPKKHYCEDASLWFSIMSEHSTCYLLNEYLAASDNKRDFKKGLSSKLFLMYMNTLDNYYYLFKVRKINIFLLMFFSCISTLKFLLRIFRFKFIPMLIDYIKKIFV